MLGELARTHDVAYLDAPVSGSTGPARSGTLVWLTSGSREAFELAEPTLRDLGSAVEYLGSGVEGSAVKIAVNAWMTSATVAMSDVLSLCDALGIDHELFARVLADGPLAMPYAQQKATAMDGHAYTAGFAVSSPQGPRARRGVALPLAAAAGRTPATGPGHRRRARPRHLAAVDYQRGNPE